VNEQESIQTGFLQLGHMFSVVITKPQ